MLFEGVKAKINKLDGFFGFSRKFWKLKGLSVSMQVQRRNLPKQKESLVDTLRKEPKWTAVGKP